MYRIILSIILIAVVHYIVNYIKDKYTPLIIKDLTKLQNKQDSILTDIKLSMEDKQANYEDLDNYVNSLLRQV